MEERWIKRKGRKENPMSKVNEKWGEEELNIFERRTEYTWKVKRRKNLKYIK